ncbi:MAG: acyl-CoA reductase [Bacteroidetes bacterium]|nr:acyl-CoA reductase [Bacteroidota bacterium]
MTIKKRIAAFHQLGEKIGALSAEDKAFLFQETANENPWFTSDNIQLALDGIAFFLNYDALEKWCGKYTFRETVSKKIGIAMAGNIPLVGFHDFLCVLLSNHQLVAKLSSNDSVLMKFIAKTLIEIEKDFENRIHFEERLKNVDAVIATGSDNTSRYFEYYFRNTPHIIRKNRTSCAVILGEEAPNEFELLGRDIFTYFGLGCRNVSKIFVPENFDFTPLLKNWENYQPIIHHHKYANNYDYQKSILLINQIPFYDSGFVLLTPNTNLVSPISTVYYETYSDLNDLDSKINQQHDKIQCIVSARAWYKQSFPFGKAQLPAIDDYADGIDTMDFLSKI